MADTKNLYQRLLAITEEIGSIEKTGRNAQQGYAFIEQSRVVAELRPLLHKHGVMIVPETVSRTIERYDVTRGNGKPGVDVHASVVSRYHVINADDPEDRIVCEWDAGEAIDSSDKATNKAVTASDKTFLMKLFNISDQDDPDQATIPAAPEGSRTSYKTSRPEPTNAGIAATPKQLKYIATLFTQQGVDEREERHARIEKILGHEIGSATQLTKAEAKKVIDQLLPEEEATQ